MAQTLTLKVCTYVRAILEHNLTWLGERSLPKQRSVVRIQSSANFIISYFNCIDETKAKKKRPKWNIKMAQKVFSELRVKWRKCPFHCGKGQHSLNYASRTTSKQVWRFFKNEFSSKKLKDMSRQVLCVRVWPVWPDWAIFCKVSVTNFLTKVAQIVVDLFKLLEKRDFYVKNSCGCILGNFRIYWATLYSLVWSHWAKYNDRDTHTHMDLVQL